MRRGLSVSFSDSRFQFVLLLAVRLVAGSIVGIAGILVDVNLKPYFRGILFVMRSDTGIKHALADESRALLLVTARQENVAVMSPFSCTLLAAPVLIQSVSK